MYYSSGNYEAFAHPKKPEGVDHKSAYIIGSGLAALTAACYLVRDGQMKGEHVHVFEKNALAGGACDGYKYDIGYVMRGGREMDNHFEVMWDMLHSIPSLETEGASVLDEYYWLNKEDPNYSLCRATVNRGEDAHTDGKFGLSDKGAMEIMKLFFTPDEDLYDKRIDEFFDDEDLEALDEEKPKHRFFKKLDDDDDEDEEVEYVKPEKKVAPKQTKAPKQTVKQATPSASSKITPMRKKNSGNGTMEVCVIKPSSMEDTREIADTLIDRCTVVLNLEGIDVDVAQRIIDFSSGACYSIAGSLQKISSYIFILTPANVEISGDFQEILSGAFDVPSVRTNF